MPAHAVPPAPEALARAALLSARQGGVLTWRQSLDSGLTVSQVRTLVRRSVWVDLGHGLVSSAQPSLVRETAARLFQVERRAVVSHTTAGLLHGFPYLDEPSEATLTVERACRGLAGIYVATLTSADVTCHEGLPITTPVRTLVDLLRTAPSRAAAQALADGVLHHHIRLDNVGGVLARCVGWPGIRQAREAWTFADRRPESPLESRHRVLFRDADLPAPELQAQIDDASGRRVARVDFLFREERTIVESDGKVKYVAEADEPDRDPDEVLWREKLREDRLRDLGFEVVRATRRDSADGGADLVRRVRRAFERSARRAA